jgi:hypothetical protein
MSAAEAVCAVREELRRVRARDWHTEVIEGATLAYGQLGMFTVVTWLNRRARWLRDHPGRPLPEEEISAAGAHTP